MKIACITPDRKHDYLVSTVLEGMQSLDVELVVSDPGNGVTDKKLSDAEFTEAAKGSDLVIAFFGKVRGNTAPRWHLLDSVKLPRSRKIYVDGSEWSATGWEAGGQADAATKDPTRRRGTPWLNGSMLNTCGHYFKREAYPDDLKLGIMPLPFALRKHHTLEPIVKDIDVFCSFGHTKTGMRAEAIEECKKYAVERPDLNIVVKSGMRQDEYLDTLRRSRIVVDCWGGGDTCDRFWEGVGARACMLYQRYNIEFPNPFTDFVDAVSFDTREEFAKRLRLLAPSVRPAMIGLRGQRHALCFHTARHRAEEILRAVTG